MKASCNSNPIEERPTEKPSLMLKDAATLNSVLDNPINKTDERTGPSIYNG
jgi:hypothetical protein